MTGSLLNVFLKILDNVADRDKFTEIIVTDFKIFNITIYKL